MPARSSDSASPPGSPAPSPPAARRRTAARRADASSDKRQAQLLDLARLPFDTSELPALRRAVLRWFARHRRDLPWRRSRDPYRIWLSEVMLQQTQVATVIGYFERFLAELPTVEALAAADESQVLRLWEGLGYYRRARQLHAAARRIVADHGGRFPQDAAGLRTLPGVGRYTAGAVASIAFDAREPILEANTVRLFARLLGELRPPTTTAVQHRLWAAAETLLPDRETGLFNQALMELGGLVCEPRRPACDACPVASWCAARQTGAVDRIPSATKRMKYEDRAEAAVVVRDGDRVLVRRCRDDERWAGMWDFPRFELESHDAGDARADELRRKTLAQTGVAIEPGAELTVIRHGVTRFRITLVCYQARLVGPAPDRPPPDDSQREQRWLAPKALESLPLSVTARKIGRLLQD